MRHNWIAKLATLCFMALAAPAAWGQNPYYAESQPTSFSAAKDTNARLAQLEAELAAIRNGASGEAYGDCGCIDACDACCNSPFFYFGYEATILKPYFSEAEYGPSNAEYGYGNRFVLGYQNGSGLGARLRYWLFNDNIAFDDGDPVSFRIDMDVIDLEATLYQRLCNWDLMVAGGIRYGRQDYEEVYLGEESWDTYFEGVGPTVALEAIRQIGCRGFYLVGNVRASLLYGKVFEGFSDDNVNFDYDVYEGETMFVFENQLGIGWARELGRGELHLRLLWESQFWHNNTMAETFGSNLGFAGPTFTGEIRF